MVDAGHTEDVLSMMQALYFEDAAEVPPDYSHFVSTLRNLITYPDRGRVVLIQESDILEGYAILIPYWSNEFGGTLVFIDELFVTPSARNRGVGTQFLTWVETERPFSCVAVLLEVSEKNERARRLYESQGYRERLNRTLVHRFEAAAKDKN